MTAADWDKLLATTAEPDVAGDRIALLDKDGALSRLSPDGRVGLVRVLGYSHFLYHFLCRHPEEISSCDQPPEPHRVKECADVEAVRRFKYRELLKLCCADMATSRNTERMIAALSRLADEILAHLWDKRFAGDADPQQIPCILALGKLGAEELNFSSDVDVIFVTADEEMEPGDSSPFSDHIAEWTRQLEERTEEGFLYRVDLRLRPWGDAGPLLLGMETMENYYAASAEAWERLVLLRARPIAGYRPGGDELRDRLSPFMYMRALSSEDVRRFILMKEGVCRQRERAGTWDIKTGSGGIRDLEFACLVLQVLHGARHAGLRVTSTLQVMRALADIGVIKPQESEEMIAAYLYLRLVENRLQMKNEQQTHHIPSESLSRAVLARAIHPDSEDPVAEFEERLEWSRAVAEGCFNRILPQTSEME